MENDADILGAKFDIRAVVREDGTFTPLGLLLIVGLSLSLFSYFVRHPNEIREIIFGERLSNEKH